MNFCFCCVSEVWLLTYIQGQLLWQISAIKVYQGLGEDKDLNLQVKKIVIKLQQIFD